MVMTLGEIVRTYRTTHHLTLQQFADRASLSKGYISMLEKGRHPRNGKPIQPSLETYDSIAHAMGMARDELIARTNPEHLLTGKMLSEEPPEALPFDPVSALLDAHDIRTVARNQIGDATPEQVEHLRGKLKDMMKVMFRKD